MSNLALPNNPYANLTPPTRDEYTSPDHKLNVALIKLRISTARGEDTTRIEQTIERLRAEIAALPSA